MANREDGRVAINSCDDNASTQWIDVSHHGALAQVLASKSSRLTPSICPARLPNKFNLDFEPFGDLKAAFVQARPSESRSQPRLHSKLPLDGLSRCFRRKQSRHQRSLTRIKDSALKSNTPSVNESTSRPCRMSRAGHAGQIDPYVSTAYVLCPMRHGASHEVYFFCSCLAEPSNVPVDRVLSLCWTCCL